MRDVPAGAENRVVLTGRVCARPQTRHSPAGIPIARFTLEHDSAQVEAERPRRVRLRIEIVAAGDALQASLGSLDEDARVRVEGFLASAGHKAGEYRLSLHARHIELLNYERKTERED